MRVHSHREPLIRSSPTEEQLKRAGERLKEIAAIKKQTNWFQEVVASNTRTALGDGLLKGVVLTYQGYTFPLPVECWRATGGWHAVVTGVVTWWHVGNGSPIELKGYALVERAGFERWHRGSATAGDEHRLKQWLTTQIRAAPDDPRPKAAMKKAAEAESLKFSEPGFDRAWTEAVKLANAPRWSEPGRRKSS